MELTCPKCHGTMRQYERNGVLVDQCAECRGIFLDRGELEKLMDAEARWADGGAASGPQPDPRGHQQYPDQRGYQQHPDRGYRQHYYKKNKKRSFLDELFD